MNNVGVKADADEVFRDIAENRLPIWLDELQTYDVQEVRHGRWVDVEPAPHNLFYATCSVCGDRQTIEVANYCPMCGASMDEMEKPRYCDRNICASNEVNGIGCDECVVGCDGYCEECPMGEEEDNDKTL